MTAKGWIALGLRLLLGALLVYAAGSKWPAPRAFAEDVANYRILPAALVPLFTSALLGLETVLGACLLLGVWRREVAALTALLMAVFTGAVGSALLRGLKIECGCFGAGGSPATVATLLRDLAFLLGAAALLWCTPGERRWYGAAHVTPSDHPGGWHGPEAEPLHR